MKHAKSVFEAEARAVKVRALVRQIDHDTRDMRDMDGNSVGPAEPWWIADFLRGCDDDWWTALARRAQLIGKSGSVLTPSTLTRDCVIAEYEARAEEDANREPSPELDEAVEAAFTDLEW